ETRAAAAARQEADRDVIPGRDLLHRRPHGLHDARALVPQNDGQRNRIHLVPHHQVGVTQAGGDDPHDDLVVAGRAEEGRAQLEGALLPHDGGRDLSFGSFGGRDLAFGRRIRHGWSPHRYSCSAQVTISALGGVTSSYPYSRYSRSYFGFSGLVASRETLARKSDKSGWPQRAPHDAGTVPSRMRAGLGPTPSGGAPGGGRRKCLGKRIVPHSARPRDSMIVFG